MIAINTNINAFAASVKLSSNAVEQTTAMQRLSTGVRVNSAKDDAAALAISTGFVSQVKGMAQAVKNVNDGISLAQTAEGALGNVVNMLQRMRELAVQSANGTLTTANRAAIQLEYDADINQINTVLGTSNFNGIKLFDGSASALQIQSGAGVDNKNTISIPQMTSNTLLGVSGTEAADASTTTPPPTISTVTKSQSVTASNTNNYVNPVYVDPNLVLTGTGKINGASVMISNVDAAHDLLMLTSPNGITSSYNAQTGILTLTGTASIADYQTALRQVQFKTDANAQVGKRNISITLGTALQGPNGHYYDTITNNSNWYTAYNDAANTSLFGAQGYLVTITSQAENDFIHNKIQTDSWIGASDDYQAINKALGYEKYANQAASDSNWYWVTGPEKGTLFFTGNALIGPAPTTLTYSNWAAGSPGDIGGGGIENFAQMYAANGTWNDAYYDTVNNPYYYYPIQQAIVEFDANPNLQITASTNIDVGEGTFPPVIEQPPAPKIAPGVTTQDDATQSMSVIDDAIGKVTDVRTYLGAMQNSMQAVVNNLTSGGVNAQQANGRLIDTDYTETTTQLSHSQIISQAATAMLAQANQSSQLVLQLIKQQ